MMDHEKNAFGFPYQAGRRQYLKAGALAAAWMAMPGMLRAQPADMTRLVVGFPPGGPADTIGRLVASLMADEPGKVVVENRPARRARLLPTTCAELARRATRCW